MDATPPADGSRLYFRQLLCGRYLATSDPTAAQMVNFVYLIGDRERGECLAVDPAWDVDGLLAIAEADGMRITGALATHYHPDHVGGEIFGFQIEGLPRLLERQPVKVHAHRAEVAGIRQVTGLSATDFIVHEGSDVVQAGDIPIELVHTPGHTPGSQCFLVGDRLVSGDTLFVQGCGRVDLPGGDPNEMYRTLTQRLARLPESIILYPGHDYGPTATSTLGAERRQNVYMRVRSLADWHALMGS